MPTPGRLTELDAMRGLAAFAVVLNHATSNLPDRNLPIIQFLRATPLRTLIDGRHAVLFFFVLSGLVLTRALLSAQAPSLPTYALRRIIRLCLPAAAALVLSAALYVACDAPGPWLDPTGWLATSLWTQPPSPAEVVRQALLIGGDGDFPLDPVLWSLVHELRFSLLLPLAVAAALRWDRHGGALLLLSGGMLFGLETGGFHLVGTSTATRLLSLLYLLLPAAIFGWVATRITLPRALAAAVGHSVLTRRTLAVCSVLAGIIIGRQAGHGGDVMLGHCLAESLADTLYFLPAFLVGVALSLGALDRLELTREHRTVCIVGMLLLLCYDNVYATVAASMLLILVLRHAGALRSFLRTPPLVFLGRVSFSLYLVHLPLLAALSHGLHAFIPLAAINVLSVLLSIPAAWALHRLAEQPAQRLAARVGRMAKPVPV